MDHEIMIAMLGYIDALSRSAETNERFADQVVALAKMVEADPHGSGAHESMLNLARRHRVDAIKGRAQIAAMSREFEKRFGVERLKRAS